MGLLFALVLIAVPAAALVYDFWTGGDAMLKLSGHAMGVFTKNPDPD